MNEINGKSGRRKQPLLIFPSVTVYILIYLTHHGDANLYRLLHISDKKLLGLA